MFELYKFVSVIRTDPSQFGVNFRTSIKDYLNQKFANKIVTNVGLCVVLFDIVSIGESCIVPGDGAAHTEVEYRFVIFRPFVDEVIIGKIKNSSPEGIHVTLGFFDDIFIPASNLQHPSRFDVAEQLWIWEYNNDDSTHDFFMDPGEQIRFKVTSASFVESSPKVPEAENSISEDPEAPYSLSATINEPGLGLLSWWEGLS